MPTWAVNEQAPAPTKATDGPLTLHTVAVDDVTQVAPSPVVVTVGVKVPPTDPVIGRLVMVGVLGTGTVTFSTTLLPASPMYTLPDRSTATPTGWSRADDVAGPGVGVPALPVPARIDRVPDGAIVHIVRVDNPAKAYMTSHQGIVIVKKEGKRERRYIRHASRHFGGKVGDMTLSSYLSTLETYEKWPALGIRVFLPVKPGAEPPAGRTVSTEKK